MELRLQNSHIFPTNSTKILSVHSVEFTNNLSGLYLFSADNLLSQYQVTQNRKEIVKKWDFQFQNNPTQILYVGKSHLLGNPDEKLLVASEPIGVVFYRANSIGLEELDTDIRFNHVGSTSNSSRIFMGNFFENSYYNPGLLHRTSPYQVKVYLVDYLNWDDPEALPLSEGELQFPPEFSTSQNIWTEPGWGNQDYILTCDNSTLIVHKFDYYHRVEKIGHARIPSQMRTTTSAQFFEENSSKKMMVYFETLAIVYILQANREFVAEDYFYIDGKLPLTKHPLMSQKTPLILMDGPTLLPVSSNGTDYYSLNSYWTQPYIKSLAVFENSSTIIYEENRTIKIGLYTFDKTRNQLNFQSIIPSTSSSLVQPVIRNTVIKADDTSSTEYKSSYDKSLLHNIRLQQFLEESVQLQSGQLQLSLPLVPFINFGLQYSFTSGLLSHPLGKHWELLGHSHISLDPGQTHFDADKRYYIVLGNEVYALDIIQTQGNNTKFKSLSDSNSTMKIKSILLDSSKNEWTVETDISKMIFGGSPGTVKEGVQTRNWVSEDAPVQIKVPLEWHLTQYENLVTGKTLQYEYVTQEKLTEGIKHVSAIILKKVTGDNALVSFDLGSGSTKTLRGYELQSREYRQIVKFDLKPIKGDQFLGSISQQFGTRWDKLIEFDYDDNTKLLNKIALPIWKSTVKYRYINPPAPTRPSYQFGVTLTGEAEDIQKVIGAVHGNGFSVLAYDNTLLIYKITDGSTVTFPLAQQLSAEHLLAMDGRCVFLLNQNVLTYCYAPVDVENPSLGFQWKPMTSLVITSPFKDIMMTRTGTVLIKQGARELKLFQWDETKSLWNTTSYVTTRAISSIKMDERYRILAWIDEANTIYWVGGFKSSSSTTLSWTPVKSRNLSSRTDCGNLFANKFDLGSKHEKEIKHYFKGFQFQLRDNVIALQSCSINDWTINTVTDLIILDNSMNGFHKSFSLSQENIQNLRRENRNENQNFIYTYEKSGGRFLVKVEAEGHPEATHNVTESFRKLESSQNERLFMTDFSLYQMNLQGSLVLLSNKKKIYHDPKKGWTQGNQNTEETMSVSIRLQENDDSLRLEQKTLDDTFKITGATYQVLHDFGTKNATKLGYFYPSYIGATNEGSKSLSVVSFSGNSKIKQTTYSSEEIFGSISGPTLLATRKTQSSDQIILRTTVWDPQMVVGQLEVTSGEFVDKTVHYELADPNLLLNGNFMFQTARVIPGKLAKLHGWIEYQTRSEPGNGTKISSKVYDGFGKFLHDMEQESPKEEKPTDDIFVLKDKSNKFEIANFYPFELTSCQSAYIGFEDYESFQTSPACSKWTFPEANIHRNKFSFTGKNFLRLNSTNEQIRLELPWEKGQDYTITAWVRAPSVNFKNLKNTLILAASLMTPSAVNWMSTVIYSSGPWTLLRLDILDVQIDPYRNVVYNASGPVTQKNVKIQLAISGQPDSDVDVDHIIVAPSSWDAQVNIRDPNTFHKTETILGRSGFVSQDRFDPTGRPFVHINPRGEVHQLQLDSIKPNNLGLKSSAVFKTTIQSGWYEYCEPAMGQSLSLKVLSNWSVSPGKLTHTRNSPDELEFRAGSYSSLVFRFWYTTKGNFAQIQLQFLGTNIKTVQKSGKTFLNVGRLCSEVEIGEENFVTLAVLDKARFALWIDQDLTCEIHLRNGITDNSIKMKISGGVTIGDVVFIPDPSLEISYHTLQDQEIQRIQLTSASTANVYQRFYDELGRQIAETKKTVITSTSQLLHFRSNFATKREGTASSPMKLEGEVHNLNTQDEGFPFSMISYEGNLMKEEWEKEGRPGSNYRIGGKYEKQYSSEPHFLIKNMFPKDQGYSYRAIRTTMGYEETSVFIGDFKSSLLRAKVAIVPGGEQLLATYEYDFHDNMIAAAAPQFHRENRSFMQGKPYSEISKGNGAFTTTYKYDGLNRLVEKKNPDGGISNLVYDGNDNILYAIHRSSKQPAMIDSILYFEYSEFGNGILTEVGVLRNFTATAGVSTVLQKPFNRIPRKIIRKLDKQERNVLFQSDLITSYFEGQPSYVEVVGYDVTTTRPLMRAEVSPTKTNYPALLTVSTFNYNAKGNKLLEIGLPYENYSIRYQYSPFGSLLKLELLDYKKGLKLNVAEFQYNGSNQVVREALSDIGKNATLVTQFSYNSPGFPTKQKNSLVEESMSYEDEGYGGFSLGKINSVMSSTSVREWAIPYSEFNEGYLLEQGLSPTFAKTCYNALVENGYIDSQRILKIYHPTIAESMPLICTNGAGAEKLLKLFSRHFIQQNSFKFKYQYGSHRDLVKAKFMATNDTETCTTPLTPTNFAEQLSTILKMGAEDATKLWEALKKERFLLIDAQIGIVSSSHGKKGLAFLTNENLMKGFRALRLNQSNYSQEMVQHLALHTAHEFTIEKICSLIEKWVPSLSHAKAFEDAQKVHDYLVTNRYLEEKKPTKLLFSPKFIQTVERLFPGKNNCPAIYKVLTSFFDCSIGTSPFDFQVYDQDANGNFKVFYTDGKRFELKYEPGTNKLVKINTTEGGFTKYYAVGHDTFGNLNKALHKNIERITYDEVFARPVEFQISDGSKVKIRYDHKGERVSKDVWSPDGTLLRRKKYLTRDEKERCLLEEEITFYSPNVPPKRKTTIFMYGPRGLVGFHRNGKLYNVYTDAIGSIRFVLLNGQVVASYDYLPYGHLMGEFVHHEDADVSYRFTGQEWDEELQLYNFHARIYDPIIGRFYQLDPEEQFFSPYKYGGNSPLNVVDPDGKFILTLIIGITLAVAGAYLGGAAANKSWNPAKWNLKSPQTWLGILLGGLSGALIIPTGGASIEFLSGAAVGLSVTAAKGTVVGFSVATAYLSTAAANKNWNPVQWDLTDPGTLNSIFGGIAMGAGLPAGVDLWRSTFTAFGTTGKTLFTIGSVGAFGGFGYLNTAASQGWNPQDWDGFGGIDFFIGGLQGAIGASGAVDGVKYFAKQTKLFTPGFTNMANSFGKAIKHQNFKQIEFFTKGQTIALAKATGSLAAVATVTYLGVANAANDWSAFTLKDASTAMALLNGLYSGWVGGGGGKKQRPGKSKTTDSNPLRRQGCFAKTSTCSRKPKFERLPNTDRILDGSNHESYMLQIIEHEYKKVAEIIAKSLEEKKKALEAEAIEKGFNVKYTQPTTITVMGGDGFVFGGVSGLTQLTDGVPTQPKTGPAVIKLGILLFKDLESDADFLIHDLKYNVFDRDKPNFKDMPVIDLPLSDRAIREKIAIDFREAKVRLTEAFSDSLGNLNVDKILQALKLEQLDVTLLHKKLQNSFDSILQNSDSPNFLNMLADTIREMAEGKNLIVPDQIDAFNNSLKKNLVKDRSVQEYNKVMKKAMNDNPQLKDFRDWDTANCGESHCLVGINRVKEFFDLPKTATVGHDQVKYVASYNMKKLIDNLAADQERCAHCKRTTESVPTPSGKIKFVITDQAWDTQTALQEHSHYLSFPASRAYEAFYNRYRYDPAELFHNFKDGFDAWQVFQIATEDQAPSASSSRKSRDLSKQKTALSITSGAATNSGIVISAVNTVKQILSFITSKVAQMEQIFNHGMNKAAPMDSMRMENFKSDKSKPTLKAHKRNCVPHVWLNGEYIFDGFTCTDIFGSVRVFLKDNSFEDSALAGSYNQDIFSDCQYMEGYFGQKSAFCSGKNSNMIYTPAASTLPFDKVNDHLLLLLVGVNLWRKWTDVQPTEQVVKSKPSRGLLTDLQEQVDLVRGMISEIGNLDPGFSIWANHFLEDREDDIQRFGRSGMTEGDLVEFREALEDLEEEVRDIWEVRDTRKEIVEARQPAGKLFWEQLCSYFVMVQ
ncbi:unnamed protein product [Allacma fusca]|uniref:Uncharacterized protein n=1 Tax=Allacma fusca TaxID=39272 RepID=A0A8J2KI92_9HEXA|nr:unnamed protein product [Allacma fusca]